MEYIIQEIKISIHTSPSVFTPSSHGSSALGGVIQVNEGESVIDIGTGTGLLAILAAKMGGKVSATDILPAAVDLTLVNAKENEVEIHCKQGKLFEPFPGEVFDVIIANVPQENLSPNIMQQSCDDVVTGMHGGKNGNEILLNTLDEARTFMHQRSRMYVVVYSMSNFRESLSVISDLYDARMLHFYTGPVKDFVYEDRNWYEQQSQNGLVSVYNKGNEIFADLYVLELTLR